MESYMKMCNELINKSDDSKIKYLEQEIKDLDQFIAMNHEVEFCEKEKRRFTEWIELIKKGESIDIVYQI